MLTTPFTSPRTMSEVPRSFKSFRGSNYVITEDESITKTYILVSNDPIVGRDQTGGMHYDMIYAAYKEKMPDDAPLHKPSFVETRCRTMKMTARPLARCPPPSRR